MPDPAQIDPVAVQERTMPEQSKIDTAEVVGVLYRFRLDCLTDNDEEAMLFYDAAEEIALRLGLLDELRKREANA